MKEPFFRVWADIDVDKARHNIQLAKSLIGQDTELMVVVKADAYGHGAVGLVKRIDDLADAYAVATVDEAVELRKVAGIKKPILVLGYVFPENAAEAIENDIAIATFDSESAKLYNDIAVSLNKKAIVHIALDTGMSRIGYLTSTDEERKRGVEDVRIIAALPNIYIEGMFTHFCKADEPDKSFADVQFERFMAFSELLYNVGIDIPKKHVCNTAGIIDVRHASLDMCRLGISTYGMYPTDDVSKDVMPVEPVMSVRTHVSLVKRLPAGVGIGYSSTYVTERDSVIATIPVGYGDGFPRGLSNSGRVLIHGKSAPIRGRICMDQCMVDVTEIDDVKVGDIVTLIGSDGDQNITPMEIGDTVGNSFHYEVVCDIAKRVPRVYRLNGQVDGYTTYSSVEHKVTEE